MIEISPLRFVWPRIQRDRLAASVYAYCVSMNRTYRMPSDRSQYIIFVWVFDSKWLVQNHLHTHFTVCEDDARNALQCNGIQNGQTRCSAPSTAAAINLDLWNVIAIKVE